MSVKDFLSYYHPYRDYTKLQGWLRKQVGRKWDEVYSEIIQRSRGIGSYKRFRLFDWLDDLVCIDALYQNGIPGTWRWGEFRYLVDDLYVDQEGVLRFWSGKNNPKKERRKGSYLYCGYRSLGDRLFHKTGGVWYEVFKSKKKVKKYTLVMENGKPVFTKEVVNGKVVNKPLLLEQVEEVEDIREHRLTDHELNLLLPKLEPELFGI